MTSAKIMRIVGWVLSALLAALFLFSAYAKFSGNPEALKGFDKMHLGDKRVLIGIGEVVSLALFLVPFTHPLGVLLLSSYMGGAILAHMTVGESYVFPAVVLVLIWIASFLRRPWLLIDPKLKPAAPSEV